MILLQEIQDFLERRQILPPQRKIRNKMVGAAESMWIGDIDREKRNSPCTQIFREIDEGRQLPEVCALQSDANAGSDALINGRANTLAHLVEGIEPAYGRVG